MPCKECQHDRGTCRGGRTEGLQWVLRRTGHQGPALPSGLLSLQRCLIQVAFRPVLPSELIRQEAFQALNKQVEVKSVRGDSKRRGTGHRAGAVASPQLLRLQGPRTACREHWGDFVEHCVSPGFKSIFSLNSITRKARSRGGSLRVG